MEEKRICINCGTNPAILSKKTGKPTHGLCKECFSSKVRKTYAKNKENESTGLKITLDFGDYPELADKLTAHAKDQMRTVSAQALWMLMEALNA